MQHLIPQPIHFPWNIQLPHCALEVKILVLQPCNFSLCLRQLRLELLEFGAAGSIAPAAAAATRSRESLGDDFTDVRQQLGAIGVCERGNFDRDTLGLFSVWISSICSKPLY